MTQEDKDLLLKDLCGRLSNGVKCKILENNEIKILSSVQYDGENTLFDFWEDDQKIQYGYQLYLSEFKPYLFPLSSMTEEQREEFLNIQSEERQNLFDALIDYKYGKYDKIPTIASYKHIDWLNANHFDYRGLIEKELALDATGLNIY